jgi:hypothetical protein
MLEEGTAPVVGRATVEELAERVEQAKAYMELLGQAGALVDRQIAMVTDAWAHAFGATAEERPDGTYWVFDSGYGERWPQHASIRRFLRSLPLEGILHAVEIAASRMDGRPGRDSTLYFYGICNKAIKEGRSIGGPRTPEPPAEDADAAYLEGRRDGAKAESFRLGRAFWHPTRYGFDTIADVVAAAWPEDPEPEKPG